MQQEQWRQKYQDALREAAADEKRWAALEAVLRRIVGRLCIAARGIDEALDAELSQTAQAIRKSAQTDELEGLFARLSAAIVALDGKRTSPAQSDAGAEPQQRKPEKPEKLDQQAAAPETAAALQASEAVPSATLQSINELIAAMLERLDIQAELRSKMTALRDRIVGSTTTIELTAVLRETTELVNQQRLNLQNEKAGIERILQQVTARLDEIATYLTGETEIQQAARDSSQALNAKVLGEVRTLDVSAQQATDLNLLQTQVRSRLDAINSHLQEFLAREHARHDEYQERSERMRKRIEELEQEARTLNLSLEEKHRQATTDVLTGLPNRLAYAQRVELEHLRWKRTPTPLCIAAWDIDRFKLINDTYGHSGGDKVLHVVGQFFVKNLRRTDFIARYGGEEFVMLLIGATTEQALRLAEGLRLSIETLGFHFHGQPVKITMSCGVAEFRGGDKPETVFERADKALYKAKQEGRNRCAVG